MEVLTSDLFLGQTGKRTLFCIIASSGVSIKPYSAYTSEAEILLPPGRRLEVKGILPQGNLQIVNLQEIESVKVFS